jgi:hypothetical protein
LGSFPIQEKVVTPSFEVLLVLGVIGFYLFDSAMLLYFNELVYVRKNNRWAFVCPESRWQILGRTLYIPNPLTVEFPLFRVSWTVFESNDSQDNREELQRFLDALDPLKYITTTLFLLLLCGLPLVVFHFGAGLGLLILFGVIYFTIIWMLILSYRQREQLGLSGMSLAKLAFDSLACAPFALNLVRKIALRHSLSGDPISFAHQNFDRAMFARLVDGICKRVDEELEITDEEGTQHVALTAYRNRILSMV